MEEREVNAGESMLMLMQYVVVVLHRSGSHRILQQGLSEKVSRDANSTAAPKCMDTSDGKFNTCKYNPHGERSASALQVLTYA
jgi:hypothetical protein